MKTDTYRVKNLMEYVKGLMYDENGKEHTLSTGLLLKRLLLRRF